jgi:hypothetical protein
MTVRQIVGAVRSYELFKIELRSQAAQRVVETPAALI